MNYDITKIVDGIKTRNRRRITKRADGLYQSTNTITQTFVNGSKVNTVTRVYTRAFGNGKHLYRATYKLVRTRDVKASDFGKPAKAEPTNRVYGVRNDGLIDFADLN